MRRKNRQDGQEKRNTEEEFRFDSNMPMEERDAEQFEQLVGRHLRQWDDSVMPDVPSLQSLERLTSDHRSRLKGRLWRDLLLFWMVSGMILSGLLLLVHREPLLFIIVQVVVLTAACLFLASSTARKEGRGKWTS